MTPQGLSFCVQVRLRREEVEVHRRFYEALGIPIVGEITGEGTVEGGDCFGLILQLSPWVADLGLTKMVFIK